jgi:pimeloyl-ACP methyl ester carboxylesterase
MNISSVPPQPAEPGPPQTTIDPGYHDPPAMFLDPAGSEGRLHPSLRQVAQMRDGNAILKYVASQSAYQYTNPGMAPPFSQDWLTAMTQLAVTGSNAFAAWSANPVDLAQYLMAPPFGLSAADASTVSGKIMADFSTALQAVRNPGAGIMEGSLRAGMKFPWIAVSSEDDSPDYPVNTPIATYPQFHLPITVDGHFLVIRYILASSQSSGIPQYPYIPPGDEVILFIHGEGSRAEEAADFIPQLFAVGAAANRSFTVVALDLLSCAYSTMIPHLAVAPPPPANFILGVVDTSAFSGTPILDFVRKTIETFVEMLIVPMGNPITAVIGGSLGGHMALRLADGQASWVNSVVAWSPASVEDYNVNFGGIQIAQRVLTDPQTAGRAAAPEVPPASGSDSRQNFFSTVWDNDTFNPGQPWFDVITIAVALLASGLVVLAGGILGLAGLLWLTGSLLALPTVPPQPTMWYRDDWGPSVAGSQFGRSKLIYMFEGRLDRREIYCTVSRQWHWRICEELLGFQFDPNTIKQPLLLMVGEKDDYPQAQFFTNVREFAARLTGPGKALSVQDTGHSIHNERPFFLATQVVNFAPRQTGMPGAGDAWLFAEIIPSL